MIALGFVLAQRFASHQVGLNFCANEICMRVFSRSRNTDDGAAEAEGGKNAMRWSHRWLAWNHWFKICYIFKKLLVEDLFTPHVAQNHFQSMISWLHSPRFKLKLPIISHWKMAFSSMRCAQQKRVWLNLSGYAAGAGCDSFLGRTKLKYFQLCGSRLLLQFLFHTLDPSVEGLFRIWSSKGLHS